MYTDNTLDYTVLEKTSSEAFQALWVELHFERQKNIICGITYRQHNSPEYFQSYFNETAEKYLSLGKPVYIMGDFNIDLLKCEPSNFSLNLLLTLQSCHLTPTIDKPSRVYNNSATLIDNILVTDPDQVISIGNAISDISDHFSQYCILNSSRLKFEHRNTKFRDYSQFSSDKFNSDLSQIDWNTILKE